MNQSSGVGNNTTAVSLQFQDIDEWVKEQDVLDAQKASQGSPKPVPIAKKSKHVVDVEAIAAEQLALEEMGNDNWVGKLQQYRDVHPIAGGGIMWVESEPDQVNPRFTCTVVISESSNQFGNNPIGFGTKVVTFSSKKNAKKYAAKKAVDWLIENNHMPADGSVKFSKAVPPPPPPKIKAPPAPTQDKPPSGVSYSGQVPELCHRLGFCPPRYVIDPAVVNSPLWNGYADFGGDPRIVGKVGEVLNVFGKKNAKEEVAKIVVSFLRDIERQRLAHDDEDKKRKRSLGSPSAEKAGGKAVKIQD